MVNGTNSIIFIEIKFCIDLLEIKVKKVQLLKTISIFNGFCCILSMLAYPGMHAIAACPVELTKSVGLCWVGITQLTDLGALRIGRG